MKTGSRYGGYNEPALAGWNLCPLSGAAAGAPIPARRKLQAMANSPETVGAIQMLADLYAQGSDYRLGTAG